VLRVLRPEHWPETPPELWGQTMASSDDRFIQIPIPRKL
jgi:hypothetical protein